MTGTILRSNKASKMSAATWRKLPVETEKGRDRSHSLLIRVSVIVSKGERSVTRMKGE